MSPQQESQAPTNVVVAVGPGSQHPPQAQGQLGRAMGPFVAGHPGQIAGPGMPQRPPPTQGYAMGLLRWVLQVNPSFVFEGGTLDEGTTTVVAVVADEETAWTATECRRNRQSRRLPAQVQSFRLLCCV